ncbi:hypothetical protein LR48_Vigan636s000800 [Vigna angularis]|uniref:Uncharacterized protein n=1 Tax=Phaseolus angularis TaxID=3914 RepID=A0A0L9TGF5_PHAAN|nr:hypothetical protein LR48_Vigan636s000800 [Vigna angularis]
MNGVVVVLDASLEEVLADDGSIVLVLMVASMRRDKRNRERRWRCLDLRRGGYFQWHDLVMRVVVVRQWMLVVATISEEECVAASRQHGDGGFKRKRWWSRWKRENDGGCPVTERRGDARVSVGGR